MKPSIKKGPCPTCGITTWSVYGPDGSHWLCTNTQESAIRYAAERAAQSQPGTGVQVQASEGVTQ